MVAHFAKAGVDSNPSDVNLRRFLVRALENTGNRKEAAAQLRILLEYIEVTWATLSASSLFISRYRAV